MQAEAGQQLEAIIARKELERRAGNGSFFWGVGNPPASVGNLLARSRTPVRAIFSVMKSRPKTADVSPTSTVVWSGYIDSEGNEQPLPPHALVISRRDSARGAKRRHYALMCRSDSSLVLRRGEPFDPAAFRNVGGSGAPVGASQVTALLRRVEGGNPNPHYEVNLAAWLTDSYWVRLIEPVELDLAKRELVARLSSCTTESWCAAVREIRQAPVSVGTEPAQRMLF